MSATTTMASNMTLRGQTVRAAFALAMARILVRFVPLSLWRNSIGRALSGKDIGSRRLTESLTQELRVAALLARRIERAAIRLPGHSKCLPKAVAMQWMLRLHGISSRLVIAIHRYDRSGDHAYHAWVEIAGVQVIGICDRAQYSSVASFEQLS